MPIKMHFREGPTRYPTPKKWGLRQIVMRGDYAIVVAVLG